MAAPPSVSTIRSTGTDITYIRTCEGFAYLTVVIDLYFRRVIGWAMQCRQITHVVMQALFMAVTTAFLRDPVYRRPATAIG